MSLDVSQIGYTTMPYLHEMDWKKSITYALGIGAKRNELDYLYEARGPKVYPTYGVIPAYEPLVDVVKHVGGGFENLVHGAQSITMHCPLPASGTWQTVGKLEALYDLKRLTQVVVSTQTTLEGKLLFETQWMIILFDQGNFGGPRPVRATKMDIPEGRAADFVISERTSPEQALIYRLSGDYNPLHIDAEFAEKLGFKEGPILHGLCTFGHVARAVIRGACDGDGDRLKALHAHFKKPVWPGDELVTEGWVFESKQCPINVTVTGQKDAILGNAYAELV
jgi:acyl dehydratase